MGTALGVTAALLLWGAGPARGAVQCNEPTESAPATGKIDPPIVLTPEANSVTRTINLDSGRAAKTPLLRVDVDPALDPDDEGSLRLDADNLVRAGDANAETVDFPDLTFSSLSVSPNRRQISFHLCLTPGKDLPAGRYTGVVSLDGPAGVEAANMTITVNAKNGGLFWAGTLATLALAYLVLLYKAAADTRTAAIAGAADQSEADQAKAVKWGPAVRANLTDLGFQARSLLTLGATFGALYAIWDGNPAWGESGAVKSLIALVGVGLAAVGARAIINPSTSPAQTK